MKISSLITCLQAAHFSYLVHSEWEERGGFMLVAPPASFKSTIIKTLDDYHDSLILSDINVQTLNRLRDNLVGGRYRTLGFPEYEKLYQRNPQVAMNLEGHVKALTEEGFKGASFDDPRTAGLGEARTFVVGGLTPSCYRKELNRWIDSGFARRFLWCHYTMRDGNLISDAIDKWEKLTLEPIRVIALHNARIPYALTPQESSKIRSLLKHQHGTETPFVVMKKIACVLKSHQKAMGKKKIDVMPLIEDFAECLGVDGAKVTL